MAPSSTRRRLLQAGGTLLALGVAGCPGASESETPPTGTSTSTETPTPTPTPTPEPPTYSNVDERVDELPPGSPALSPSGSWPSFRFDAGNTGSNPDGDGLRNGTEYWRLNAGGAATVANGTLYNVFRRGGDPKELTYRNPATVAVETRRPLVGYGVTGPPVFSDGRVFVNTFIEVFCFDAETGEQLWRGPEMDGILGRPTVDEGTVYVNSGGYDRVDPHVRAFDAATGDQRWRYDVGSETKSTPAVDGDFVFVTGSGGVYGLEKAAGEEVFHVPDVSSRWGSPVVHGGVLYAADQGSDVRELVAMEIETRDERWRQEIGTDEPPVVTDDRVYTRAQGRVAELDRQDGTILQSGARTARPMGLVGDVLYAAGHGTVRAIDRSNDLEELWSLRTEEVQISDMVGRYVYGITPVDGAVYVSARDAFYGLGPVEGGP